MKVPPALVDHQHLDQLLGGAPAALDRLRDLGDEVRLRGDRHLGVRVEHEAQQRRAGAGGADDERNREAGRPAPVEAPPAQPVAQHRDLQRVPPGTS